MKWTAIKQLFIIVTVLIATVSPLIIINYIGLDNTGVAFISAGYFYILLLIGSYCSLFLLSKRLLLSKVRLELYDKLQISFCICTGIIGIVYFETNTFINVFSLINFIIMIIGTIALGCTIYSRINISRKT